jgi:hypothetical protein
MSAIKTNLRGASLILTETITWVRCGDRLPDDETTVMLYMPGSESDPVWLGYHTSEGWLSVEGSMLNSIHDDPTHWAHLPAGPSRKQEDL